MGISVSQHRHHDHALAVQAAHKAEVDRAVTAEAAEVQHLRATAPPPGHQASVGAKVGRDAPTETQQLRAAALVRAANHQAEAGPARPHPPPVRPRPAGVTDPGAVSEVRGAGATLIIPALQVRAPIVATGAVDGSMSIPADIHTVGWYDGTDSSGGTTTSAPTPWPGQPGVSLLAGHVDWSGEGPGALYYINQLVAGDPVEVIGFQPGDDLLAGQPASHRHRQGRPPGRPFLQQRAAKAGPCHLWRSFRRGHGPLPGQRHCLGLADNA